LTQINIWSQHQNGAEIVHIGMSWARKNQIVQGLEVAIGIVAGQVFV
jgi:hypothetical protein